MSANLTTPTVTDEDLQILLNPEPITLHYINTRQFESAVLNGGQTTALCGYSWYPQATEFHSRGTGLTRAEVICDACSQIYNTYPEGSDQANA